VGFLPAGRQGLSLASLNQQSGPSASEEKSKKMKTQKEIEETLKIYKPFLKEKFKVKEIGIFGSCLRGEESEKSDVDV